MQKILKDKLICNVVNFDLFFENFNEKSIVSKEIVSNSFSRSIFSRKFVNLKSLY